MRVRNRLLRRGLSSEPDAVIANGDHVYWDLEAHASHCDGLSPIADSASGASTRTKPQHNARS